MTNTPKNPPKYPCGTCNKAANTNSVECVLCGMWHHLTVTCMPWHSKDTINSITDMCKDSSCWTCGKCKVVMTKVNLRFGELERQMTEVQKDVEDLQNSQTTATQERKELKEKQVKQEKQLAANTNNVQKSLSAELKSREERKKNVLVMGLEESASEVSGERIDHDKKHFSELLESINVNKVPIRLARLGKKVNGRQRPLLAVMNNEDAKEEVLDRSRNLDRSKGISIKPDLTQWQRDDDKDVRDEVDTLNKNTLEDENGPFHWAVAGRPGQLRKKKVKGRRPADNRHKRLRSPRAAEALLEVGGRRGRKTSRVEEEEEES